MLRNYLTRTPADLPLSKATRIWDTGLFRTPTKEYSRVQISRAKDPWKRLRASSYENYYLQWCWLGNGFRTKNRDDQNSTMEYTKLVLRINPQSLYIILPPASIFLCSSSKVFSWTQSLIEQLHLIESAEQNGLLRWNKTT